jgi:hypothetical protein
MNAAQNIALEHRAPESVRVVDDIADLSAIYEDAVNIVVLRRSLLAPLAADVVRVVVDPHFRKLIVIKPNDRGRSKLNESLAGLSALAADIGLWAEVIGELTGCELVGVRLERVITAMCPRFHTDKVPLRVVSAFAGAGTEYLATEDVDRDWLGHTDEATGPRVASAKIRRAAPGDLVLLKGEAWPNNSGRGAIHRSPPASSRAPRLVLTLDPL